MGNEKKSMTVAEAGSKGGKKVLEQRGKAFFSEIGKIGGRALRDARGPDYFKEMAKKSTAKMKEIVKEDPSYYSRIGKIGGAVRAGQFKAGKK